MNDINVIIEDAQPIDVSITDAQPINVSLGESINYYSGSPSGESSDKNYIYQLTGETDVVVTHDLSKFPSVTVFDSSGNEVQGDYQHLDISRTKLIFSAGFSGKAIFN